MYNFDEIINRENTNCLKFDNRKAVFGTSDVIPMWVADMDFKTPDFITNAIHERAKHPVYGYSFRPQSYFEAVKDWAKTKHDWNIETSWITFNPGVVSALAFSVLAFTKPGDKIIVQSPVYFPFFNTVTDNGRQLIDNPLKLENNRYTMDFDDLQRKIDSRTKLLLLCSPHNPVGRVWTKDELTQLGEICRKNNIYIISDEIHADLVLPNYKHIPMASVSDQLADITLTTIAPSKTFNLSGLCSSVVIASNQQMLNAFKTIQHNFHIYLGNVFANVATEAAYRYGLEWVNELNEYIAGNYNYLRLFFEKNMPLIKIFPLEGTYLMWMDCRELNLSDKELNQFFVNEAGVGLSSGYTFGTNGSSFMRMNLGCQRSVVEKAANQILEAYKKFMNHKNE